MTGCDHLRRRSQKSPKKFFEKILGIMNYQHVAKKNPYNYSQFFPPEVSVYIFTQYRNGNRTKVIMRSHRKFYIYRCNFKKDVFSELVCKILTPNTPLIQLWCARSKLDMDETCSLNIQLWYVDIPQIFLLKSLHAQTRSFLLLDLEFDEKIPLSMK